MELNIVILQHSPVTECHQHGYGTEQYVIQHHGPVAERPARITWGLETILQIYRDEALNIPIDCLDEDTSEYDTVSVYLKRQGCIVLTDEHSADKDGVMDNLSRNQIGAPCTITASIMKTGIKNFSLKIQNSLMVTN
ncbi:hypothetical protein ElyMa_006119900 [Elysia marginata]|uniref:Uncharacterized protein n=1 Tax=Elysia marginata TaxID=1093978 RepID=A0AAV4GWC4_9GAST|nr:hypothetical protein ElyMa_006119900 [Elysia marginata]